MKIAVIQLEPLHGYTRDFVNGLTENGCNVDLIISGDAKRNFIDLSSILCNVYEIKKSRIFILLEKIRNQILKKSKSFSYINAYIIRKRIFALMGGLGKYDLLIGIEKSGLEIAYLWALKNNNIPYVYWSLELYLEDHPDYKSFSWKRKSEKNCHQYALGTIIQDKYRWAKLQEANNKVNCNNVFYFPIGTRAKAGDAISNMIYLRNKSHIKLLYFGVIAKTRMANEIFQQIKKINNNSLSLRLHGPIGRSTINSLFGDDIPESIRITTTSVSENMIYEIINESDIGIALYRTDNCNDRYTVYSSQKIALYLQCGKPIIVFKTEVSEDLFKMYKCGEMIDSINELENAIEKIKCNYTAYHKEALCAYNSIYNSDMYFEDIISFLGEL